MFLAAQLVSIVTIITTILGLLSKYKYQTMIWFTISNISMLVTYLLLGRFLPCLLVAGAALRTIIYFFYAKYNKKPQLILIIFFEIYFIAVSIFLWKDYVDILMLANLCLVSYTTWQNNMTVLRVGYVLSGIFLITYDAFVGAYVDIASQAVLLISAIISIIRLDCLNKIKDIVLHFYKTIRPTYEMTVEKKGNDEYYTIYSKIVNDEYNNFAYFDSLDNLEENICNANKEMIALDRRPAIYLQSKDNENINQIMGYVKGHKLLFHDTWMKLKNGYNTHPKKCLLENVVYKKAGVNDYDDAVKVFKEGFVNVSGNDVYKLTNDYVEKYEKQAKTKTFEANNITPYIAYHENKPIGVLFMYTNGANAYLCQITTLKEYRRLGVASGLIRFSIKDKKKQGVEDFYLVTEKYTFLETFYLKNNFEEISQGFCIDFSKKPCGENITDNK